MLNAGYPGCDSTAYSIATTDARLDSMVGLILGVNSTELVKAILDFGAALPEEIHSDTGTPVIEDMFPKIGSPGQRALDPQARPSAALDAPVLTGSPQQEAHGTAVDTQSQSSAALDTPGRAWTAISPQEAHATALRTGASTGRILPSLGLDLDRRLSTALDTQSSPSAALDTRVLTGGPQQEAHGTAVDTQSQSSAALDFRTLLGLDTQTSTATGIDTPSEEQGIEGLPGSDSEDSEIGHEDLDAHEDEDDDFLLQSMDFLAQGSKSTEPTEPTKPVRSVTDLMFAYAQAVLASGEKSPEAMAIRIDLLEAQLNLKTSSAS